MEKRSNKLIAPVLITILVVIYFIFYIFIGLSLSGEKHFFIKVLIVLIPVCLIGLSVYMLIERINEIRGGEEDDLSKY